MTTKAVQEQLGFSHAEYDIRKLESCASNFTSENAPGIGATVPVPSSLDRTMMEPSGDLEIMNPPNE